MKRLSVFIAGLAVLFSFAAAPAAKAAFNPLCPTTDSAGNCTSGPCAQGSTGASSPTCQQNATQNGSSTNPVVNIIHVAADLIASIAGVAAVIVIIISGIQFITAGGASPGQRANDPNKVKAARGALTGALIGLVIIALAWSLVTFVVDHFIG